MVQRSFDKYSHGAATLGLMADQAQRCCWQVLDIIAAALSAMGNAQPDVARGFLDITIQVSRGPIFHDFSSLVASAGFLMRAWQAAALCPVCSTVERCFRKGSARL